MVLTWVGPPRTSKLQQSCAWAGPPPGCPKAQRPPTLCSARVWDMDGSDHVCTDHARHAATRSYWAWFSAILVGGDAAIIHSRRKPGRHTRTHAEHASRHHKGRRNTHIGVSRACHEAMAAPSSVVPNLGRYSNRFCEALHFFGY